MDYGDGVSTMIIFLRFRSYLYAEHTAYGVYSSHNDCNENIYNVIQICALKNQKNEYRKKDYSHC